MNDMVNSMSVEEMEIKKSFFDYWGHVENIVKLTQEQTKLVGQEIRAAIIDILALGIQDKDPMTDQPRKRHVLSAPELLEEINKRLDQPTKKSNLYFHLEKLEDAGLIKVVDQIPQGKRYTTYYGRTAKAFVPSDKEDQDREKLGHLLEDDILVGLLDKISDKPVDEIEQTVDHVFGLYFQKCPDEKLSQWLDKYQEIALLLDLDVRSLYNLFDLVSKYDIETIKAFQKFAELLDFPLD